MNVRQYTLDWVNAIRKEHALGAPLDRLPAGHRKQGCECPVARALGHAFVTEGSVELYYNDPDTEGFEVTTPLEVSVFIRQFDHGLYADLEALTA
jgi:hypothetical protein